MWKCQATNGFPILLQVASAAFPRMESSVMVDLSEFGLLVGYLSWVARIGRLDGTRWHMLAPNMRRSFYGYSTYIKIHVTLLCICIFHFYTYIFREILAHACISTNIQYTDM